MNWITISFGVIVSSVVLYLAIRKAKELGISLELRNLAMFALPALIFYLYSFLSSTNLTISLHNFAIILFASIFFSWLGNIFSLKGLDLAPNQGYSLMISKSYVVFVSIASVWIFNSPLTIKDVISIVMIIAFSSLILLQPKDKSQKSSNYDIRWIFYTFGAFFAWSFLAIVLTHLTAKGLSSPVMLFYLTTLVSILIGMEIVFKKIPLRISRKQLITLAIVGIGSTFFNLGLVLGYKYAPNPGYINAVNAGSISLVTIFSALIFKDHLSARKLIGVFGVVAGLIVLFV